MTAGKENRHDKSNKVKVLAEKTEVRKYSRGTGEQKERKGVRKDYGGKGRKAVKDPSRTSLFHPGGLSDHSF